jgi:hypothetical protein
VDLGESLGKAVAVARLGDQDLLEVELARLRSLTTEGLGSAGPRLRALSRSVREHPSSTAKPHAQAV